MLHEIARKSELSMRNDGVKTIRSRIFGSHPDVVYHDIANDEGHLQMVCDHRLKLLKASRRDLQQAQRSVEALLIVIKHISEKVKEYLYSVFKFSIKVSLVHVIEKVSSYVFYFKLCRYCRIVL